MKHKPQTLSFFQQVYTVARQIPVGRVSTYGAIGRYLGAPQSARMVGWAMNAAHSDGSIPAHRVVNRVGLLTGKHHFPGSRLMEQLLENEGVLVVEDKIQQFKVVFWDPSAHLNPWENVL